VTLIITSKMGDQQQVYVADVEHGKFMVNDRQEEFNDIDWAVISGPRGKAAEYKNGAWV